MKKHPGIYEENKRQADCLEKILKILGAGDSWCDDCPALEDENWKCCDCLAKLEE